MSRLLLNDPLPSSPYCGGPAPALPTQDHSRAGAPISSLPASRPRSESAPASVSLAADAGAPVFREAEVLLQLIASAANNTPRIPISGATNYHIALTAAHINQLGGGLRALLISVFRVYAGGIHNALQNHNQNICNGRKARAQAFDAGLADIVEEMLGRLKDLSGDVVFDVDRALEE